MARNKKYKQIEITGDYLYNSIIVSKLINCVMKEGKKHLAIKIVYCSLNKLSKLTNLPVLESILKSINNVKPILEVKSRRIGGSNYQIPIEVTDKRSISLAIKWIINAAQNRNEKNMSEKLTMELYDAFNNKGNAIKKRKNVHSMAEANKAFSHFRW